MFVSDFDLMMAKKKEEMQRQRRKRKDVDLINDNDDLIADLIVKMKEAANVSYVYMLLFSMFCTGKPVVGIFSFVF